MHTLYFNHAGTLTEVGNITTLSCACNRLRLFLQERKEVSDRYLRFWAEQNKELDWCIMIDYGSWSAFFMIGGFDSAEAADAFVQEGFKATEAAEN